MITFYLNYYRQRSCCMKRAGHVCCLFLNLCLGSRAAPNLPNSPIGKACFIAACCAAVYYFCFVYACPRCVSVPVPKILSALIFCFQKPFNLWCLPLLRMLSENTVLNDVLFYILFFTDPLEHNFNKRSETNREPLQMLLLLGLHSRYKF